MAEYDPSSDHRRARWPLILGSVVGGVLLLAAGVALGWYLFYRPIVNVAVQLPAPLALSAGPDTAQLKALEDQNEKQKAANKQIEEQIALLKQRLRADVCTAKDPLGKDPPGKNPPASSSATATEPPPTEAPSTGSARSIQVFDLTAPGGQRTVSPDWASIEAQPLGSKGNPVRCFHPPGQHAYLRRLQCPDGSTPVFQRQGNVGAGPYTTIVDAYEVRCAGKSVVIYLDMYHPGYIEQRAVPGFTIKPSAG
ncbi:MAG: hypothetical protein JOY64_16040 [Alphaproteobacteria bacterium]|nr:hypothetical protein [Alphaproteobacteria bacterium]